MLFSRLSVCLSVRPPDCEKLHGCGNRKSHRQQIVVGRRSVDVVAMAVMDDAAALQLLKLLT